MLQNRIAIGGKDRSSAEFGLDYIEVAKDFVGKKPRTRVALTREGRRAFVRHVAYLKALLEG